MKLEWPIFTSTSPLLLLRPITMRFWRIIYSKSLPSKRAIAAPFGSGLHARLDGLAGADFRANNAQASLSEGFCNVDMARIAAHQNGCLAKAKQGYPVPAVYIKLLPGMHRASHVASFLPACDRGRNGTVKWHGSDWPPQGIQTQTAGHLGPRSWPNLPMLDQRWRNLHCCLESFGMPYFDSVYDLRNYQ